MKVKLWTLVLGITFFFSSGSAQNKVCLEIGEKIPKKWANQKLKPGNYFQTSPFGFDPFVRKVFDDVEYLIAYDKTTYTITYIRTGDGDFKTVDGLKVGDYLDLTEEQVTKFQDWEIHAIKTQDGWKPVIGYNRPPQKHETESGFILIEDGDPTLEFKTKEKIHVKILFFSKTRFD